MSENQKIDSEAARAVDPSEENRAVDPSEGGVSLVDPSEGGRADASPDEPPQSDGINPVQHSE